MDKEQKTVTNMKSFLDLDEAVAFLEQKVLEAAVDGYEILESSGIRRVNHQWQVGIIGGKEVE